MSKFSITCTTALAPLTWGTTYLVATQLLPLKRPLLAAALRALPIGLLLLAGTRRLPRGRWWWRAGALGALNIGALFALLFIAAERLPGGVAATAGAVSPLLVAALAWPVLGDRPTPRALVAGLAGLAGIALLVLRADARLDALGVLAGLAGALSLASGTVLTKRWGRPAATPLPAFTAWQLVAGELLLAPLALLVEGPPPPLGPRALLGFAYLGLVGTGAAYALWFRGIERMPAPAVALLALLSPIVATGAGFLVLRQTLTPPQAMGAALVLGSILAGQRAAARRNAHTPGGASTVGAAGVTSPTGCAASIHSHMKRNIT